MTGRRRSLLATAGPPAVVLLIVVAGWYVVSYALLAPHRRFLLPPPHEVISVAFLDWDNLHELLDALWSSALVALVGLAIATVLGIAWAIAMSQAVWVERSLYPYAVVLQTIPILALVPLIGFWFSFSFTSRVIVCVLISLFPIITNTLFGLVSVDRAHHDLFTLHGASRWTRLRRLELPAAMPAIMTGLRIAAGLAVIGAIVGDFFFHQGHPGIGARIQLYQSRLMSEQLIGAVMLASLLGLVVFWAFGFLGARLVSWHPSGDRRSR